MTHFNISVTVKHHRGNNFEAEDLLTDIQNCCIKAAIILKNSKDFWNIMNLISAITLLTKVNMNFSHLLAIS